MDAACTPGCDCLTHQDTIEEMDATTNKFLVTGILAALVLIVAGCDQTAFEPDYEIPEDGSPYVHFDSGDTVTVSKTAALDIVAEVPISAREDVTVSFTTTGSAVPGVDFAIPDTTVTDSFEVEIEVPFKDSTITQVALNTYSVSYDPASASGSVTIGYNEHDSSTDAANITIVGLGNASINEPRDITLTLTSAATASGEEIRAGNLNEDNKSKTIIIGP